MTNNYVRNIDSPNKRYLFSDTAKSVMLVETKHDLTELGLKRCYGGAIRMSDLKKIRYSLKLTENYID